NHHAWPECLPEMPKAAEVCAFDAECEQGLAAAKYRLTPSDVYIGVEKHTEALLAFAGRVAPRATRIWFIGESILTHTGVIYRSAEEAGALDAAFEAETGVSPRDLQQPGMEQLAEAYEKMRKEVGGAQAYRFRCWREREGIEPTPGRLVEFWRASQV